MMSMMAVQTLRWEDLGSHSEEATVSGSTNDPTHALLTPVEMVRKRCKYSRPVAALLGWWKADAEGDG
jgi:hypothetical protein